MEDIFDIAQNLMKQIWKDTLNIDLQLPFPRMTYEYAMNYYGSDKPDTRFGLEFIDLIEFGKSCDFGIFSNPSQNGGCLKGILIKGGATSFSRKEIDALVDVAKYYKAKGLAWHSLDGENSRSSFAKNLSTLQMEQLIENAGMQQGDILFILADMNKSTGLNAMGQVRLQIGKKLKLIDESKFNFVLITEFPMFEKDEENDRFVATHHPFTMPMEEDISILDTDPISVRAQAYDVVLNGYELSSGSIRIHDRDIQNKIFNLIGFDDQQAYARFGFLLDAFKYGAPPHGGMAFGLDRLTMMITGRMNIRDVVAFPKLQNSTCPLTESPSTVDKQQLKDLGIAVIAKDE